MDLILLACFLLAVISLQLIIIAILYWQVREFNALKEAIKTLPRFKSEMIT